IDYTVRESLAAQGLAQAVEHTPSLPHSEAVRRTAAAQVLLIAVNRTPGARGIVPGKCYEYLAARRPVLCIGPVDGDAAAVLRETGAGTTVDFDDLDGTVAALRDLYARFRTGRLSVESRGLERYSRDRQAGRMAALLDEIVAARSLT